MGQRLVGLKAPGFYLKHLRIQVKPGRVLSGDGTDWSWTSRRGAPERDPRRIWGFEVQAAHPGQNRSLTRNSVHRPRSAPGTTVLRERRARFRDGPGSSYGAPLRHSERTELSVVFLRSRLLPLPLPPPWGSDSIRRTRCKLSLSRQRGPTLPQSSPAPHSAPPPFPPQSWSPGSLSDVVSSRTPPLLTQPPRCLEIPALMYRRCPHLSAALPPLRRRAGTVAST